MAAIAANPEVYWEIVDLLPPEALTETKQLYEQIVSAVEKESPIPPIEGAGEPAPDQVFVVNLFGKDSRICRRKKEIII